MADLPYIQMAQEVKITGQDSSGTTVNYVTADTNGRLGVITPDTISLANNITANGQNVTISTAGMGSVIVQVTGTWTGTLSFTASVDGTNYFSWYGLSNSTLNTIQFITSNDQVMFNAAGIQDFRVSSTSAWTGTAVVSIVADQAASGLVSPFTGTGSGGGAFPVTIEGTPTVIANAGTNLNTSALALHTDVNALSLSLNATTSGQKAVLVQGAVTTAAPTYVTGNSSALSLTTAGALRVDGSGVTQPVSIAGNININNFPAVQTVAPNAGTSWNVIGALTNNNAAPAATLIGVLPALAESAINASRYTTGNQVLPVVDLAGNTNVDLQYYLGAAVSKTNPIATTITDGTNTLTNALSAYGTAPTGTFVEGVNAFITNAPTVAQATAANLNATVVGTKTNNNAAPGANNFGVLPALANAAVQTWTEGDQVALSVDLAGNLRSIEKKDIGRNQTNYFMALQIVSTATDALMSLTGYKSGAAVGATTTPAVVTTGKTYRINSITLTYVTIVTTPGAVRFTLRANTGGVVAITSPAVAEWTVGEPTGIAPVAGKFNTVTFTFSDGIEFAAGTGIGLSQIGINTIGTAAAVGYGIATINGFEY